MTKEKMIEELEYALGALPSEESRQSFRNKFMNSKEDVQKDIIKFFILNSTQELIYKKTQERLGV